MVPAHQSLHSSSFLSLSSTTIFSSSFFIFIRILSFRQDSEAFFLGVPKIFNPSLLTGFVEIFQMKELVDYFGISLLNIEGILGVAEGTDTTSSQQVCVC